MKQRIGIITAVFFFFLIGQAFNSYAEDSLMNKVKDTVSSTVLKKSPAITAKAEDMLKQLKDGTGNITDKFIDDALKGTEELFGKDGKAAIEKIQKEIPSVINKLKSELEKAPNDTKLLIKLAIAYKLGGKYTLAIYAAEKILAKEPGNINAAMLKSQCYKAMGQGEKALNYIEKYAKEHVNNADLMGLIASLKIDLGKKDEAVNEIEKAIKKIPNPKELYCKLAEVYDKLGEKEIKLFINGEKVNWTRYNNVKPIMSAGVTLVPIRAVADRLNAEISYNPKTKEVKLILKDKKVIVIKENGKTIEVNNKKINLGAATKNIKGSMMVPIRFISEQLNKEVKWYPYSNYGIISIK